jgi:hypothetical protein
MVIWPCLHCRYKATCDWKASIVKQVRGIGLSTAKHKCPGPWVDLAPGDRVEAIVRLIFRGEESSYSSDEDDVTIAGTVMQRHGQRLRVWLDEAIEDDCPTKGSDGRSRSRQIISLYPDRLRSIGGTVPVCGLCGRPENQKNAPDWHCDSCNPYDA